MAAVKGAKTAAMLTAQKLMRTLGIVRIYHAEAVFELGMV